MMNTMPKLKQFLRWFLFVSWLGLGLYAVLVESEQNWRLMFAGACFLLSANTMPMAGKENKHGGVDLRR